MPRTFTLSTLRTKVREQAEMESSTFCSDAEINRYISSSYTRLYGLLVQADPERYMREETFAGDGTTRDFSVGSDYLGTLRVDYTDDSGERIPLVRVFGRDITKISHGTVGTSVAWHPVYNTSVPTTQKIRLLPTPTSGTDYTHCYIVAPADLTSDGTLIDGVAGWEEYIVLDVAIKCRIKEGTPVGDLERQRADLRADLDSLVEARSASDAGYVIDVRGDDRALYLGSDDPLLFE